MKPLYLGWLYLSLGLLWAGGGITQLWFAEQTTHLWFYPVPALGFSAIGIVCFRQHRQERSQAASSGEEAEEPDA
ncbi:hypothetical protein ABZ512_25355 [Nocardiopsis dassonvillei]|uniref:hypothetical protein n=1 Tax=Nocardiopsis dassonvillei TaxID=2014 RepID=UPI0033E0052D